MQPKTFFPHLYVLNQNPYNGWMPIITIDSEPDMSPAPDNDSLPLVQQKIFQGNEEGYSCVDCHNFYPYAALNIPDFDPCIFRCYSCRKGLSGLF